MEYLSYSQFLLQLHVQDLWLKKYLIHLSLILLVFYFYNIKYFEYYFETNEIVSYLKIADLSDWEVTNFSNHYLIGNIYGNRGENANDIIVSNANLNCTGIYNITAIVSSYYDSNKPNTDYSQYYTHQLYINSTANLFEINTDGKAKLIEPCIIEHNGTKWLALKKVGSSCYIRFTGLMNGILPSKLSNAV